MLKSRFCFCSRFALLTLGLLLILPTSRAAAQFGTLREGDKLDAVVGVVGKYPIYKSIIDGKLQLMLLQKGVSTMPDDSLMLLRKAILNSEVDAKVLLAKSDQDSIVVSETQVDERIDQQISYLARQLGSTEAVEKQFGKTVAELKASPEYRQNAREGILIEQERQKAIPNSNSISRHDVEEFYSLYRDSMPQIPVEVHLATIIKYVKPQANQKEKTRALAESIADSIKHGADFATMAKRYSQHVTATDGGDLGSFYARGTFVPEYEEAAFKLKPGESSGVVETDQGYFIIKLIERRGEEIHVAQILIKTNASAEDEEVVRNEVLQLRDRTVKGEDFSKLATENSDDAATKGNGGDLGNMLVEALDADQREVVDSLLPGEVSMPLKIHLSKTIPGFQIVKLLKRIPPHTASLQTDYREIEAYAQQWKQARDFQNFVDKARAGVYIHLNDLAQFY